MDHSIPSQSAASSTEWSTTIQRIRQFRCFGVATVEAIGFWTAVSLPIPTMIVLAGGIGTLAELGLVTLLFAANLLAFYIGHGYGGH